MPNSRNGSVLYIIVLTLVIVTPLALLQNQINKHPVAKPAQAQTVAPSPTPSPALGDPVREPNDTQAEVDGYIRTIFGRDARVAMAIQRVECNPLNRNYPKCVYVTTREHSCGVFQINLKAHWDKVPVGDTFEEKCEYLNDPYNNVLIAHKIFSDSGFTPWSGYTSGRYLEHL